MQERADGVLRVSNLTKRFGDLTAVDRLNIEVRRGEILGFLGPNGAGKTTSLRMMCGLLRPDAGTVEINGRPLVAGRSRGVREIGVAPQELVIWEALTCLEQLELAARLYDLPPREARARARRLLGVFGLSDKARRLGKTLSSGMQRRLNIALGLVHEPELLFLDEPQAGLDPQSRVLVRDHLQSLRRSMTVIVTTHDMEEAEKLCDRVCIVDHGKLLVLDTIDRLKSQLGPGGLVEITIDGDAGRVLQPAVAPLAACGTFTAEGASMRFPLEGSGELLGKVLAEVGRLGLRLVAVRTVKRRSQTSTRENGMGVTYSRGTEAGQPRVDRATCTVCGACATTCPTGTLVKGDDGIEVLPEATFGCIACAQCMLVCPTGSVTVTGRGLSPADVVELPPRGQRATTEQLEALLLARRSVRRFTPEPVAREALDRIVAAAAMAPMGIPPWEVGVVVFHGRDRVRTLARDTTDTYARMLRFIDNAPVRGLMSLVARKAAWEQMRSFILPLGRSLVEAAGRGRDDTLYDAPAALLFHTTPFADEADAVIACTYAMIAAEAAGLGTTMIGCVAPPLQRRKDVLRKYGVPEGNTPRIVLILGHPAVHFRKAIRRSFLGVSYFEPSSPRC
jgi:ABC-2 type transport system ATP-binding protein